MGNQVGGLTNYFNDSIDTLKGSYYANLIVHEASVSAEDRLLFPEYYGKNICVFIRPIS